MKGFLRRREWLLHLTVVGAVAALVGLLVTRAAACALAGQGRIEQQPPSAHAPEPEPRAPSMTADHRAVVKRNLFCSSCVPQHERPPEKPPAEPDPTVALLEKAELVATLIDPRDDARSAALVRVGPHRVIRPLSPGRAVGAVEIVAVEPHRVVWRHGEKRGEINYHWRRRRRRRKRARKRGRRKRARKRSAKRRAWLHSIRRGIRRTGKGRYRVSRQLVKKIAANPQLVVREARLRPHRHRGRMDGYQIRSLRGAGVLRRMGLRRGDVIRSVNGTPITSPDRVLQLYTKMANYRHVRIAVKRGNRTVALQYAIQ